ncbi:MULTISPECIES: SDR family oxidoreductase [Halomonadaceae]|jgi:3-oxoacyl-[acyl-carrier protein] reductase|uniref:SDR family oxidoreductase n=1 Tax=Halomonadaceae TaxID=28256 RepID=UPI0015838489|nr:MULTISPECIES: SDR family oxidoreductase [Halomonas]MDI4638935.1 SDR family oxidoreductase [Halomonas sp. BMC7]NUJ59925.1 SDR family oxidoreductase [Halomonas taeanensis]|tara:strand:- start:2753 stop:3514 length:762 start_codon:yes stop_codon:yes gene_type:complete
MQMKGAVIAITGGARGLGLAMARHLGQQGARLALLDLERDTLDQAVNALLDQGIEARAYELDVADQASVSEAFSAIVADMGPLKGLVNNAGITRDGLLVKVKDGKVEKGLSLKEWQQVIDVNLTGVFLCGQEAAYRMVEAGEGGVIVNISSISRAGNMGQSNYSAAKAGVAALTVTWAKELARSGIRVGAVAPGFIETEMTASIRPDVLEKITKGIPLGKLGQPDDIAQSVAYIFANDYFSGRVIECDGGLRV